LVRIYADTVSETLLKLSKEYKEKHGIDLELDKVIVLNEIANAGKIKFQDLSVKHFVNKNQLKNVIQHLTDLNFIQRTGRTSDTQYIIHKSKLAGIKDEKKYLSLKKQERFKQIELLKRYLVEFKEIDNEKAREILNLPDSQISYVSRLLSEMLEKNIIEKVRKDNRKVYYSLKE
jgi:ATP-dependent DNA helicase RecG